ncbi:HPr family phosphocarrier protein [Cytobacillus sp. FJAT-54145]|uniref:HPr family phosphocarrier protein n=1 Tax=Cytobacillus spartinae TaxID=3299023 RepID=A0ABW6K892_9BACI
MIKRQFRVIAVSGFARTASLIVSCTSKFNSNIVLQYNGKSISLERSTKAILDLMSLGIMPGTCFTILADGSHERQAILIIERTLGKNHLAKAISPSKLTINQHHTQKRCCC